MTRKKKELPFQEKVLRIRNAELTGSPYINRHISSDINDIPSLEDRIKYIFDITNNDHRPATNMLFFIMYDVSSTKVRNQIVKYLERKGCIRIQRSIFLADLDSAIYDEIRQNLSAVQAAYENNDSILIVPLSTDYLKAMKIIGQSIQMDVIVHNKNTLFF